MDNVKLMLNDDSDKEVESTAGAVALRELSEACEKLQNLVDYIDNRLTPILYPDTGETLKESPPDYSTYPDFIRAIKYDVNFINNMIDRLASIADRMAI